MRIKTIIIILTLAPILSFSQSGIGIRGVFGYSGEAYGGAAISYQDIGKYEINGSWNSQSFGLSALKLFELIDANAITIYTGIGGGAGTSDFNNFQAILSGDIGMSILMGPIQFSVDWRPGYEIINPDDSPWKLNFGFAIRFMFPEKA